MKLLNVVTFFFSLFTACHSQNPIIVNLNAEDFKATFEMEGGLLVDVRTNQEVQRGRLKDASVINFYDSNFDKQIAKLQRGKPIFVYCKSGGRSSKVANQLVKLGYQKVYNLSGGVMAWKRAGYSLIEGKIIQGAQSQLVNLDDINELIVKENNFLLDFHTKWCVPCRKLSPIVDEVGKELPDVTVLKVDIDQCESCALQWGIEAVPTLVHFKQGKEVWRHSGLISKLELTQQLQ